MRRHLLLCVGLAGCAVDHVQPVEGVCVEMGLTVDTDSGNLYCVRWSGDRVCTRSWMDECDDEAGRRCDAGPIPDPAGRCWCFVDLTTESIGTSCRCTPHGWECRR